jgi:MoxR-like ATPase
MLSEHLAGDRVLELSAVSNVAEVVAAQDAVGRVHASAALRRYVVALVEATRRDRRTELGASPRAGLMLLRAAVVEASLQERDHVLPDDVQALAATVLEHRLLLAPGVPEAARSEVVASALERVSAL